MELVAIALAIAGNLGYHLSQKVMRPDADPWLSLAFAYAAAFAVCTIGYTVTGGWTVVAQDLRKLGWPSVGVGVAIVGIELGFLLAYRAGWRLNTASLMVNVTVAVLLLPIAYLLFHETLSLRRGLGVLLAVAALALLTSD